MGKFDNNKNLIKQVKHMTYEELDDLSVQIRSDLVKYVSKNGGHLASNLGIVELTLAIHRVFDSPKDKIIFDVGHQAYVHKMLTGRYDEFDHLRQLDGLSGFPKRLESVHDMFDSGHSGTSIGACYGFAKARDLRHEDYSCVCIIGDGSLTSGVAFEALNSAGASKTPMIVILNDNEKSISDNVGGLKRHLDKLRRSESYNKFKQSIKDSNYPGLRKWLTKVRDIVKFTFVQGAMFEALGFKYFGPIDGHNIKEVEDALKFAKIINRPVLLHVVTKKGKGFKPSEENPSKFHGIGKFDPETVDSYTSINKSSWSYIFGDELVNVARTNRNVVAITAAMADGTGLSLFQKAYPDRFFDVGISEQNAFAFAEGLALNGCKPFIGIYSTFLQRAYDQVLSETCLQNLPIVIGVDRSGVTGQDGETHQGQFDTAYLKLIPNLTVLSPRDESMLRAMVRYASKQSGPIAIKYPRGNAPKDTRWNQTESFDLCPELVKTGKHALIISDGSSLGLAMDVSDSLMYDNIGLAVCDIKSIKPLDEKYLVSLMSKYNTVFTLEDGTIKGGLGESIAALAAREDICKVKILGWPDKYIEHGSVNDLRARYNLDAASIEKIIKANL